MRITKWLLGGAAGLFALATVIILTVTLLIDPKRFRGQIEKSVREATGRPFEIRGDLDISWFPWLAVRTGVAALGNPPGVGGPPLAEWTGARVGVRLIPLLRGELIIDRVRFEGLRVRLTRLRDGHVSWSDLLESRNADGKTRRALEVAGLELRDGALDYVDERDGTRLQLSGWQLDVGAWKTEEWVPVSTQLRVEIPGSAQTGQPPWRIEIRFATRARLSESANRLELRSTELDGRTMGGSLPEKGVEFETALRQLTATFAPLSIDAPQWKLRVADAELEGSLVTQNAAERLGAHGTFAVKAPSTRGILNTFGVDAPMPRDASALGPLAFSASWTLEDGAFTLKPVHLQIDETTFTGELFRSNDAQAVWTFALQGDRIDLRRYLSTGDTDTKPFELPTEALRAMRVQGTLAFRQAQLADARLKNARLRLVLEKGQLRAAQTDAAHAAGAGSP